MLNEQVQVQVYSAFRRSRIHLLLYRLKRTWILGEIIDNDTEEKQPENISRNPYILFVLAMQILFFAMLAIQERAIAYFHALLYPLKKCGPHIQGHHQR